MNSWVRYLGALSMSSSNPTYITQNRLGIYIFQFKIPLHFRKHNPELGILFRKSLRTRNRRAAIIIARKLAVIMNELIKEYFNDDEDFAAALKLLQQYNDKTIQYNTWKSIEENYFIHLDDYDEYLLTQVLDYRKAVNLIHPDTGASSTISDSESRLHEAIKNQHKAHINSIPLVQAFDEFISDNKSNWKSDGKNEKNYRKEQFALFHSLVGNIQTGDLKKSHSILYKKAVLQIPINRNKGKYKQYTTKQLMEMIIPDSEKLSTRSKQKYLQRLSGFLQWLQKNDYAIQNIQEPLQKVVSDESIAHEEKNQYTYTDLTKLFNSKSYTQGLHDFPFKFWVPLICLFTGARENEICQLHIADIYQHTETDIWVIDINQNDEKNTLKSIKRGMHSRLIPIHSQLIKLGFLDFFNSVKDSNEERLFPDLPYRSDNKYADKLQRWFNNTYTNKSNCNITTPKTSFHSLRHTLETYLGNILEMPIHKIEVMMGQKPTGGVSTGRYIKPIDLEERKKYLNKVNFEDCIDFNKIRKWKHHNFSVK